MKYEGNLIHVCVNKARNQYADIEAKNVNMYAQDWTKQQAFIKFMKGTSKLTITCGATMSFTADRNFKIQFDYLIDSE